MHRKTPKAEYRAWENSLQYMYKVLNDRDIPHNSGVAIEYNIPLGKIREYDRRRRINKKT
jgi:hypothetical protein